MTVIETIFVGSRRLIFQRPVVRGGAMPVTGTSPLGGIHRHALRSSAGGWWSSFTEINLRQGAPEVKP